MTTLFILFLSAFTNAQGMPPEMPKGHRQGKPIATEEKTPKKRPDHIAGQCVVLPGGGNLIASPCPEVIITLEGKGDPIHTRTDRNGIYEFATEAGEMYKVISGSKFYNVVSPDKPIQSGQTIEIHLQQKN